MDIGLIVSIGFTLVTVGTLWGKHARSVEVHAEQITTDRKDQEKVNEKHELRMANIEDRCTKSMNKLYDRILDDERRRDDREDKLREGVAGMIEKVNDKLGKNNVLYGKLLAAVDK